MHEYSNLDKNKKFYTNLFSGCYLTDDEFKHIVKGMGEYTLKEEDNGFRVVFERKTITKGI